MKYLDMPVDNDANKAYAEMLSHIERGRSVAIVPVKQPNGKPGVYIYSAKPESEISLANTFHHCTRMVLDARQAAAADNCKPIPKK